MNYKLTIGIIILIIDSAILFYRRDIFIEIFHGTPINEIDISRLLLPLILLVVGLYFFIKKDKNNEKPVYSGETDHVIPWQTDQGFCWQPEVANAVEELSKVVV